MANLNKRKRAKLTLAATPQPKRYPGTADGARALRAFLQDKNEAGPSPIRQPDDVSLNVKTCRLQGEYRLTTAALSQLCSMLCPGFGQVMFDVSGLRRAEREDSPHRYSPREAARLFNLMVRFRGEKLVGNELILDRRAKTVEGVVGPEYQYYSNVEFWERVQEFLASDSPPTLFQGAVYRNRRLTLRYRFKEPALTLAVRGGAREPFYGGWHFSNSEVGDCAVHMVPTLYRKWSSSTALLVLSDLKMVVHRGARSGFTGKLGKMLEVLRDKTGLAGTLKQPLERLIETPLGLGGSAQAHQRRVRALKAKLVRGKLGPRFAKQVLMHVLLQGSYKADALPEHADGPLSFEEMQRITDMEVFEARTAFDLYNALGIRAKYEPPERQERAEQLAYRILVGQFTL